MIFQFFLIYNIENQKFLKILKYFYNSQNLNQYKSDNINFLTKNIIDFSENTHFDLIIIRDLKPILDLDKSLQFKKISRLVKLLSEKDKKQYNNNDKLK